MSRHLEALPGAPGLTDEARPQASDPGPFGIDGPEFSDRDREMFCLGYDFATVKRRVSAGYSGGFTVRQADVPRLTAAIEEMGHDVEVYAMPDGWARFGVNRRT